MDINVIIAAMNEINAASIVSTEHTTDPHTAPRRDGMVRPEDTLEAALERVVGRFGIEAVLEAVAEVKDSELEEANDVLLELSRVEESILAYHEAQEELLAAVDDFCSEGRMLQRDPTLSFNEGIAETVKAAQASVEAAEEAISSNNKVERLIERLASMGIEWNDSDPAVSHEDAVEQVRERITLLGK